MRTAIPPSTTTGRNIAPRVAALLTTMGLHELPAYVEEVLGLRERYRGRIEVRLGIEADYAEGHEALLSLMELKGTGTQAFERYADTAAMTTGAAMSR